MKTNWRQILSWRTDIPLLENPQKAWDTIHSDDFWESMGEEFDDYAGYFWKDLPKNLQELFIKRLEAYRTSSRVRRGLGVR